MLENAEVSILEAEMLRPVTRLAKTDKKTTITRNYIALSNITMG